MLTVPTQITAVTVFPDRARVTRAGSLALDPGAQTLVVESLPHQLDPSSVRAFGKGAARLTGVQMNRRHHANVAPGAAKDAQAKVQELLDQDTILADEAEAWQARLDTVKKMGDHGGENLARGLARKKLSLDDVTGTLDYFSQSYEAASTILRDLAVRRRELAKEIEAAKHEAEKLQNAAVLESYEAQVNLDVQETGTVEIELTYTVYGANWNALYDARLDGESLEWNSLAQVQQRTGEDWNVPYALTLSTATLATGLDKPELPPWRIDAYRPPEPRPAKMRAAAPAPEAMVFGAQAAPLQAMALEQAVIASHGHSVTYNIQTPRAIPSDGEPHQVNITTLQYDAALDYFCAPKVDAHAFVRAKFTNRSEYLMLAGDAALYHGADFVGTRRIETIAPGQEVELFLGAEERIQIERKETERDLDKNFLGTTARANLAYRIVVKNPALDSARLTVLDQIPVSQHPDIKVKLREANPKPAQQNEQGELAWDLNLAKGVTAEITFAFTVEYPKELRVAGL